VSVITRAHGRQPADEDRTALDPATGIAEVVEMVRPFTMVPKGALIDLAYQVRAVLKYDIPGDLVECGVWRGGCSFLMAETLRRSRARITFVDDSSNGCHTKVLDRQCR
jgi:hypothetical protein